MSEVSQSVFDLATTHSHTLFLFIIYRFRQEYRLERKLLSELSVDPESIHLDDKDLAALVSPTGSQAYRISRVVVLHDNKLETFVDEHKAAEANVDDFFDNDSFWSGSITWY